MQLLPILPALLICLQDPPPIPASEAYRTTLRYLKEKEKDREKDWYLYRIECTEKCEIPGSGKRAEWEFYFGRVHPDDFLEVDTKRVVVRVKPEPDDTVIDTRGVMSDGQAADALEERYLPLPLNWIDSEKAVGAMARESGTYDRLSLRRGVLWGVCWMVEEENPKFGVRTVLVDALRGTFVGRIHENYPRADPPSYKIPPPVAVPMISFGEALTAARKSLERWKGGKIEGLVLIQGTTLNTPLSSWNVRFHSVRITFMCTVKGEKKWVDADVSSVGCWFGMPGPSTTDEKIIDPATLDGAKYAAALRKSPTVASVASKPARIILTWKEPGVSTTRVNTGKVYADVKIDHATWEIKP